MTTAKRIDSIPTGPARERVLTVLKRYHPRGMSHQELDSWVDVGSFEGGERLPAVVDELIVEGLVGTEYFEGKTQPLYHLVKEDERS